MVPAPARSSGRRRGGAGWRQPAAPPPREEEHAQRPQVAEVCWQPMHNPSDTLVHFHKSFGVMQELFEHRDFSALGAEVVRCAASATPAGTVAQPRFMDLGCAPGGFSACLLQDHVLGPRSVGFGTSLPEHLGGFGMAYSNPERLVVQHEDLLALSSHDLLAPDNSIDLVVADAQYLSSMVKQKHLQTGYRGLHVRSKMLGIWALTVKECQLAFAKLRHTGTFMFRFSWRGHIDSARDVHPNGEKVDPRLLAKYVAEEDVYKTLTHWLFSVLKSLFGKLTPFKSEYVHQADVSFYMVCRGFDREKYEATQWKEKLQRAFDELTRCEDEFALVAEIRSGIADTTKAEIDELLERVGRMRAIGIQSRKVTNPQYLGVPAKPGEPEGGEAAKSECGEPAEQAPPSDASTAPADDSGAASSVSAQEEAAETDRREGRGPRSWPLVLAAEQGSPPAPAPVEVGEASLEMLGLLRDPHQTSLEKALHVQAFQEQLQMQQGHRHQPKQEDQQQLYDSTYGVPMALWASQYFGEPAEWPAYSGDLHPAASWPWYDAGADFAAPVPQPPPVPPPLEAPELPVCPTAGSHGGAPLLPPGILRRLGLLRSAAASGEDEDDLCDEAEGRDNPKGLRRRKRAGHAARERRNGGIRPVHGASILSSLRGSIGTSGGRLQDTCRSCAKGSLVHVLRFALFAATSWSMSCALSAGMTGALA